MVKQSFRKYLEENTKEDNFSKMEKNPFVWLLVIPRLLKLGKEEAKKDEILKNAIDVTLKVSKDLPKKGLEKLKEDAKPFPIMDLFKMSNNYKVLFANYFDDFRKIVCNETETFTKALELDEKLTQLYNSPEYEIFKNNI